MCRKNGARRIPSSLWFLLFSAFFLATSRDPGRPSAASRARLLQFRLRFPSRCIPLPLVRLPSFHFSCPLLSVTSLLLLSPLAFPGCSAPPRLPTESKTVAGRNRRARLPSSPPSPSPTRPATQVIRVPPPFLLRLPWPAPRYPLSCTNLRSRSRRRRVDTNRLGRVRILYRGVLLAPPPPPPLRLFSVSSFPLPLRVPYLA